MRIKTNVASLNATRELGKTGRELKKSYNKLSSGSRITRASDDAASLSISEKLKAKIRAEKAMNRSANDAMSFFQYAESATSTISNNIIRMRELAIQAASETLAPVQRGMINKEVIQLRKEIDRISQTTEMGGRKLLSGDKKSFDLLLSDSSSATTKFDLSDLAHDTHSLGIFDIDFMNARQARLSLNKLDFAIKEVGGARAKLGAYTSRLQSAANNLSISNENHSSANSKMRDADYAKETANNMKQKLKEDVGVKALQASNLSHSAALKLIG